MKNKNIVIFAQRITLLIITVTFSKYYHDQYLLNGNTFDRSTYLFNYFLTINSNIKNKKLN